MSKDRVKTHKVGTTKNQGKIKSPSDTTIYAPALRRGVTENGRFNFSGETTQSVMQPISEIDQISQCQIANLTPEIVQPERDSCPPSLIDQISNFVEQLRFEVK